MEDTFDRRQGGADEEIHLIRQVFYLPFVLLEPCINLFQPTIDDMAFEQIFLQDTVRPAAKKCSIPAVHTIADRKDASRL